MIFNRSLDDGIVPQDWKMANVTTPVFKKGQDIDHGNYRPVSLTSHKCKKLQFIHKLTASDTSKTAKITKR